MAAIVLALGAASASAYVTHNFEFSFNGTGTAGALGWASDVAFDAGSGDAYVMDPMNQKVDKFGPNGTYAGEQLNGSSTPAGVFRFAPARSQLAVDNSGGVNAGDLYVADTRDNLVDKFTSSGSFLCQITGLGSATADPTHECSTSQAGVGTISPTGVAVDSSGNLWVADRNNNVIDEFDPAGNYTSHQISDPNITGPTKLAFDSAGDLYVTDYDSGHLLKFAPAGTPGSFTFAGVIDSNSPESLAVDPADNHVYVGEGVSSPQVSEYDAAGTYLDSFGAGRVAPASSIVGLAVRPSTGEVYAADLSGGMVDVYTADLIFPDVTTGSASSVTPDTATVSGTVNPDGTTISDCHFDYGTSPAYGSQVPCPATPSGSTPTPVTADLSGLSPDTTYYYRLSATNTDGHTSSGQAETFQTTGPPTVAAQPANSISTAGATLFALVDPHGFGTTVHFEYGTSTSYGSSTPSSDVGSGTSNQQVNAQITGLAAGTTYHFRAVATNSQGTTDGPDYTLTTSAASCPNTQYRTGPSAGLPDCRAYERVSPADKGGYPAHVPALAVTGDRVSFVSAGVFAGEPVSHLTNDYLATRGATGWTTVGIDPPPSLGVAALSKVSPVFDQSPDLGTTLFSDWLGVSSAGDYPNATQASAYVRHADGSFTQATPVLQHVDGSTIDAHNLVAASGDLSHLVVFDDTPLSGAGDTAPAGPTRLYDVVGANTSSPSLRLASVDSNGNLLMGCPSGGTYSGTGLGNGFGNVQSGGSADPLGDGWHYAISQDGSRIFMTSEDPALGCRQQLFGRVDGSSTLEISHPAVNDECTTSACTSAPPEAADFQGASADGQKAYFLSTGQLTDTASQDPNGESAYAGGCGLTVDQTGCNLYLYDFSRPAGHELVDVSAGDTSGLGPEVRGVVGLADDGSRVYFIAGGLLTTAPNALGQIAQAGASNLYLYDAGTGAVRFIADTCTGVGQSGAVSDPQCFGDDTTFLLDASSRTAQLTPDGRYLVFDSYGQLTPDDSDQAADVYEYDAQTGSLVRVSVGHDGQDQNGNDAYDALLGGGPLTMTPGAAAQAGLVSNAVSANGQTIVFHTVSPLQNSDGNLGSNPSCSTAVAGTGCDVYEWHQGEVSLISGGLSSHEVGDQFTIDPSGQDIVFSTDAALVPQDTDGLGDVYDALIDGGFPAPAAPPTPCTGDACQGQSGAPAPPSAGTVTFTGPGNTSPGTRPHRIRVLSRAVRGNVFMIRVRVPAAGQVTIAARGIRKAHRRVTRAGTYGLRVRLDRSASRRLVHKGSLRIVLRVAYAALGAPRETASVRIRVLRRAGSPAARASRQRTFSYNNGGAR